MKTHIVATNETHRAVTWYDRSNGWVAAIEDAATGGIIGCAEYLGGAGRAYAAQRGLEMLTAFDPEACPACTINGITHHL